MKIHLLLIVSLGCAVARPFTQPPTLQVPAPTDQPGETRGFVRVPIDWDRPERGQISIFYRLVGSDPAKPLLVFFNGGPGLAASRYVSLDRKTNVLAPYEGAFRILLIDQRGTGLSNPIDVDSPAYDPSMVVRFFASPQHAKDAAAVLRRVMAPGEKPLFFSHSYGSQIILQYLALPDAPMPAKIALAAPAIAWADPLRIYLARRRAQRATNHALLDERPGLREQILRLKERIRAAAYVDDEGTPLAPQMVGGYFRSLTRAPESVAQLERWLDRMNDAKTSIAEVAADLRGRLAILHDILVQTLATTDLFGDSIAALVDRTEPLLDRFEPWMLDEGDAYRTLPDYRRGRYRALIQHLHDLRGLRTMPDSDAVQAAFARIPLLYVSAEDDLQLAFDTQREQFQKVADARHSTFRALPVGGHGAAFSLPVASEIVRWLSARPDADTAR